MGSWIIIPRLITCTVHESVSYAQKHGKGTFSALFFPGSLNMADKLRCDERRETKRSYMTTIRESDTDIDTTKHHIILNHITSYHIISHHNTPHHSTAHRIKGKITIALSDILSLAHPNHDRKHSLRAPSSLRSLSPHVPPDTSAKSTVRLCL